MANNDNSIATEDEIKRHLKNITKTQLWLENQRMNDSIVALEVANESLWNIRSRWLDGDRRPPCDFKEGGLLFEVARIMSEQQQYLLLFVRDDLHKQEAIAMHFILPVLRTYLESCLLLDELKRLTKRYGEV